MWGLSFQRKSGTVVLIDDPHILPTPFGAERSNPILLMLSGTACDSKSLNELRRQLKGNPPGQTIRWQTFSMDRELAQWRNRIVDWSRDDPENDWVHYRDNRALFDSEQMFRRSGFVCYLAPAAVMRRSALRVARLGDCFYKGMDYTYLADQTCWPSGEVQVFDNYLDRCSAAAAARKRSLSERRTYCDEEALYAVIARRRDGILRQRKRNKRSRVKDAEQTPDTRSRKDINPSGLWSIHQSGIR